MSGSVGSPLLWVGFTVLVFGILALDLGLFQRKPKDLHFKEALFWVLIWVVTGLTFNAGIWFWFGPQKGLEFFTGYLIEYALSVDNIFVFLIVFSYFAVPSKYQHRVIFWGILGAMLMRGIFIGAGSILLQKFHWILYIFGGFLIFTGIRTMFGQGEEHDPSKNPVFRIFRKWVPMTTEFHGSKFIVKRDGRKLATPLLLVLVVVECTDVIFAIDSVPAIFAITHDPFIIFSSNIFAILGLRALYFVLAGVMGRLRYLKVGLGLILTFVGIKMVIEKLYKFPIGASLAIIGTILALSVIASLVYQKRQIQTAETRSVEKAS